MKQSNYLKELILSLTKPEKRYFKVFASTHKSKNLSILLFDEINKNKVYDESLLREKFRKEFKLKQFHVAKNYLYHLILKALSSFYQEHSVERKLNTAIDEIEILFHKGLYIQSYKTLLNAKKSAIQFEKYLKLLNLIEWENRLAHTRKDPSFLRKFIGTAFQEELNALKILTKNAQLKKDSIDIVFINTNSSLGKEILLRKFQDIVNKPEVNGSKNEPFFIKAIQYYILSSYHLFSGRLEESFNYDKLLVDHLHAHSYQLLDNHRIYIAGLNNIIFKTIRLSKFNVSKKYLLSLKQLNSDTRKKKLFTEDVNIRLFIRSNYLELLLYYKQDKFEEMERMISRCTTGFENFQGKISNRDLVPFFYLFAAALFRLKKYSHAFVWINRILNEYKKSEVMDLYCQTLMLELLVFFSIPDLKVLSYKIPSVERFFKKHKRYFETEKLILNRLKGFIKINASTLENLKIELLSLRREIGIIYKDNPAERNNTDYFNYLGWLNDF
ncbi:MAG: hypothetical protein A3H98_09155 [Bacteroidetes bacterium RIFCSPLOWO2_02_FULL_36_8]|nr:MAG: hypothetical protein A3H98_09155 [Bacteroidetes bacterium RIFCSPLOWO2_02_FULL_36_8]OFY69258.1 MAG: hypothetical protein A3G23_02200 [Bacteroidetes bacterium RIFCSPLOWO2_12_FULL_37_12]